MPRHRLRNKRLERSADSTSSVLANISGELAWMQYGHLEAELTPSSSLEGLLQLLQWRDLQHLVCTERAHSAYHQARSLLQYGVRKIAIDDAIPDIDHCDICLVRLWSSRGSCVMCHTTLICANCVVRVTEEAVATLPFPSFHRIGEGLWEVLEPLRQGDALCLVCHPAGAARDQAGKVRIFGCFCDLLDGMMGHGAWTTDLPLGEE